MTGLTFPGIMDGAGLYGGQEDVPEAGVRA